MRAPRRAKPGPGAAVAGFWTRVELQGGPGGAPDGSLGGTAQSCFALSTHGSATPWESVPQRREVPGPFAVPFLRIVVTAKARGGFRLEMTADNELLEYPCGRRISSGSPWGRMVPAKIPRRTRMRSRAAYWSRLSAHSAHSLDGAARPSISHRSEFEFSSVLSVRPTSFRTSRPEPSQQACERVRLPVKDEA